MRLAVFTNKFPSEVNTFFSRDIRNLIDEGFDVDIFPLYPLEIDLWEAVPDILNEGIFPRSKVHHTDWKRSVFSKGNINFRTTLLFLKEIFLILISAVRFGLKPISKSLYSALVAWGWAKEINGLYDHIVAYWGNYSATSAYLYQRLTNEKIPMTIFLHAGTDLYRDQVYLEQKIKYFDNIFVVSEFNRKFLEELYPQTYPSIAEKIHLYYLGIDIKEFPYTSIRKSNSQIVAVGSLSKRKGFEYLLYAIHELKTRGIPVSADFAGDGAERDNLVRLAEDLGIADSIHFWGWLPFDQVKSLMTKASMLVHPSSELGDSTPTVIKEAMALGTPAIASSIAGIPEVLDYGRCGELVPPKDIAALADAIDKIMHNDSLRMEYSKLGRKFAEEKFDLRKNRKQLAEVLQTTKRFSSL